MSVFIYSLIAYATGFSDLVYLSLWMAGIAQGAFGGPLQNLPGGAWIRDALQERGYHTLYFTGLFYEERNLVRQFGDEYLKYPRETGGLVPGLTSLVRRN